MPRTTELPGAETATSVELVVRDAAARKLESDLVSRSSVEERCRIARSPWLGPDLAARLTRSKNDKVRGTVAGNPHTPPAVLARLAADRKLAVRELTWANPSCPFDAVGTNDLDDPATLEVAQLKHPNCPPDIVDSALDDGRRLRTAAIVHPNLTAAGRARVLADGDRYQVGLLMQNPSTTHAEALNVLNVLAVDQTGAPGTAGSMYRWQWAAQPNAAPDWLAELAEQAFDNQDQGTIARIAAHPNTPGHVLAQIVEGHAHRDYALSNPSCPVSALLREVLRTPDRDPRVTDYGWKDRCQRAAVNPAADATVLAELTTDAVRGMRLFEFTRVHARSAAHARVVLAMAPDWTGNLADLLDAAGYVTEDTAP